MYQEATIFHLPASLMTIYLYGLYLRTALQPLTPNNLLTYNPKLRMHMNVEPLLGQVVVVTCYNSQVTIL